MEGGVYAACSKHDRCWYRAIVEEIMKDDKVYHTHNILEAGGGGGGGTEANSHAVISNPNYNHIFLSNLIFICIVFHHYFISRLG